MTVRATEILKAIQKLNPAEKHRLREYLIDALGVPLKHMLLKKGWIFTNSNLMERFVRRGFITYRTSIITTVG